MPGRAPPTIESMHPRGRAIALRHYAILAALIVAVVITALAAISAR